MDGTSTTGAQGADGAQQNIGSGVGTAQQSADTGAVNAGARQNGEQQDSSSLERLIQSAVDRATQKLGTKNKQLESQIQQLQTLNMTEAEKHEHEISAREKALKDGEAALKTEQNKLYAMGAIKKAGLDDGSADSIALIDLVMADDEKGIDEKVKSLGALVTSLVQKEINRTFVQNGRSPGRGDTGSQEDPNKKTELGTKLGRKTAEADKRTRSVLDYYKTGGKNK